MTETFGQRLRSRRLAMIDPETGRGTSQEKLARTLLCSLSVIRKYELGARLPHPLIRRELLRLWPDLFGPSQIPPQ